ncbi:MAG: cysteine--tRNA ligase [Bacteroidetes bacterium]|nr:cysteine--tRNA ligase [Bacteroidota bacterium]MBM3425017.1 cysteine--tRNA ligase [Bacteroidota bacterium]
MMMSLHVYNTLTGKKEVFKSIAKNAVGMYVCGPTVYGEPHLGHARSSITFDVIYRYLTHLGYKVRYVRNITDVGHLEDEHNETGEDKIVKKARIEQLEPMEVAQHYTNVYRQAMHALNIIDPSIEPLATGHIPEQIETIAKIIENGLAYEVNGSVYFDVQAYVQRYHYGQLSGRVLEELLAASRADLEGTNEKKFHADFALWKKAGKDHLMQWQSPWGRGFPGWHIECTAMSSKYLGIPFDIHGGGMDLKFPHHEAEICQSLGAYDKPPVNYWLHNNMVTLNGQKMAKSKGNFITLNELFSGSHSLLQKAYSPMTIRFFILQAHYGSTIDFSNESLIAAENALTKLEESYKVLDSYSAAATSSVDEETEKEVLETVESCYEAMNDDFNTAKLIAALFGFSKIIHKLTDPVRPVQISAKSVEKLSDTYRSFWRDVLGMRPENANSEKIDDLLGILIELRQQAKDDKNYSHADLIRQKLEHLGIQLKDGKDGATSYFL